MFYQLPPQVNTINTDLVIIGTGEVALHYCHQLQSINKLDLVAVFAETSPTKTDFVGRKVVKIDELLAQSESQNYWWLIATMEFYAEIKGILLDIGVEKVKILPPPQVPYKIYSWSHPRRSQVKKIFLYPEIDQEGDLEMLGNKLDWYLPGTNKKEDVSIYAAVLCNNQNQYDRVIKSTSTELTEHIDEEDLVLLWKEGSRGDLPTHVASGSIACVDPNSFARNGMATWQFLYYETLSDRDVKTVAELAVNNYQCLLNSLARFQTAYLFGSGPSIDRLADYSFDDGIRVMCNASCGHLQMLRSIRPHIITIAEYAYFAHHEEARTYLQTVTDYIYDSKGYLIVPEFLAPLVIRHFPSLQDHVIGMPFGSRFNIPTPENFFVNHFPQPNILTTFMLPIAASVADVIYLAGFDGQTTSETDRFHYAWDYSKRAPTAIYESAEGGAGKILSGTTSDRYYQSHCHNVLKLIEFVESHGKKVRTVTPSSIPALNCRKECLSESFNGD